MRADLHVSASGPNECECLASRPGRYTAEDTSGTTDWLQISAPIGNRTPVPRSIHTDSFRQSVIQSMNVMEAVQKYLLSGQGNVGPNGAVLKGARI